MKKKFAAFVLCVICLLSVAGCGQTKDGHNNTQPAAESEHGGRRLSDHHRRHVCGAVPGAVKSRSTGTIWIDATTPLVGAENAETATDMLLGMCMAEPYGPEAAEKYAADPDSMAFNCYFLGGVDEVCDGRSHDHRPGRTGTGGFLPHL